MSLDTNKACGGVRGEVILYGACLLMLIFRLVVCDMHKTHSMTDSSRKSPINNQQAWETDE